MGSDRIAVPRSTTTSLDFRRWNWVVRTLVRLNEINLGFVQTRTSWSLKVIRHILYGLWSHLKVTGRFFYTCNDIYPECSSAELNNSYLLSSNHKFTWNTSRAAVLSSNIQCSIIIGFFLHGRSIVVLVLKKKEGKKERCTGGCRAVEMMRGRIKSLGGSCTPTWRCLWTLTSPRQLAQLALTQ